MTKDGVATSHYAYDANGNRIDGPGLTSSPAYDTQDRQLSYGNCTYAYKADGSLQTKTCGTSMTTFDYDAFSNLRHVTMPSDPAAFSPRPPRPGTESDTAYFAAGAAMIFNPNAINVGGGRRSIPGR